MALDAGFSRLADAVVEWLDNGHYGDFTAALEALDVEYMEEFDPLDPAAPREARIAALASRYAAATRALSEFRLVGQLIESRRDMALAELIGTVAEPAPVPEYWGKLVRRVMAQGITQPEVHPSSRALARHLTESIRAFNGGKGAKVDETYSDLPVLSWADLPREFSGYRLVDVMPDDVPAAMRPIVHKLPPKPDIAFFAGDQVAPPVLHDRAATYRAWIKVIEGWAERKGRVLDDQQPDVWAMLLAHRMPRDNSDVRFFNGRLIESPWQRGGVVRIEVVEDDLPEHLRGGKV